MLYANKNDTQSWKNDAALVTEQNKADGASSKQKMLFSPDCAAAQTFRFSGLWSGFQPFTMFSLIYKKNVRLTAACSLIIYGYNTQQMLLKVLEKSRTPENVANMSYYIFLNPTWHLFLDVTIFIVSIEIQKNKCSQWPLRQLQGDKII